jgi:hypothetical protein
MLVAGSAVGATVGAGIAVGGSVGAGIAVGGARVGAAVGATVAGAVVLNTAAAVAAGAGVAGGAPLTAEQALVKSATRLRSETNVRRTRFWAARGLAVERGSFMRYNSSLTVPNRNCKSWTIGYHDLGLRKH